MSKILNAFIFSIETTDEVKLIALMHCHLNVFDVLCLLRILNLKIQSNHHVEANVINIYCHSDAILLPTFSKIICLHTEF